MVRSIIAVIVSYISHVCPELFGLRGSLRHRWPKPRIQAALVSRLEPLDPDGSCGHVRVRHHRRAHLRGDCAWTQSDSGFGGPNLSRRVIAGDSGDNEEQGKRRDGSRGRCSVDGGYGKGLLAGLGSARISVCQRGGRGIGGKLKKRN